MALANDTKAYIRVFGPSESETDVQADAAGDAAQAFSRGDSVISIGCFVPQGLQHAKRPIHIAYVVIVPRPAEEAEGPGEDTPPRAEFRHR